MKRYATGMRVVAIVQARLGSTRFHRKVLADLAGKPMLQHVVERLRGCRTLDDVVVAVPSGDLETLQPLCAEWGVECLGPHVNEADLLGRYYAVAVDTLADGIVRVTSDNPCVDPHEVDRLVLHGLDRAFAEAFWSNTHNFLDAGKRWTCYPNGVGAEWYPRRMLEVLYREETHPLLREHPHLNFFLVQTARGVRCPREIADPELRLDVDTQGDLDNVLRPLFEHFGTHRFTTRDVIAFLGREGLVVGGGAA